MKALWIDALRASIVNALADGPTQVIPLAQRLGVDAEQVRQQCLLLFREGAIAREPRTQRARMVYKAAAGAHPADEHDPHPIQRVLAAEWKGHPFRDPLVAALFGPAGQHTNHRATR
ncbi:hypothetical protein [Massilia antarctica]|uniref:hypothetical protein n=1 Tax=Massilia antarctica TaxID=2765360 RepID=UPI0006BB72B4|nr:hypothetical protein [Massilia sp. H27-R4]MCY0911121.1 hypothetical protein [Massilia sp. H27-R4]CUI05295.1 hypothetical protein BN2497_5367 [Janthinobacterium sp. CG23_2]CUU29081.1 hypothetical protein BN3177_5367 [Janthinobacterium sp. CG23_2]